jgi:hypothetical protein
MSDDQLVQPNASGSRLCTDGIPLDSLEERLAISSRNVPIVLDLRWRFDRALELSDWKDTVDRLANVRQLTGLVRTLATLHQTANAEAMFEKSPAEVEQMKVQLNHISSLISNPDDVAPLPPHHSVSGNIFSEYADHYTLQSSPTYELDRLERVLKNSGDHNSGLRWSSDTPGIASASVTVRFKDGLMVLVRGYRLRSGFKPGHWPYLQNWTLSGLIGRKWIELDEHSSTPILSDGLWHDFSVLNHDGIIVDAIRLCQTGRNRLGSSQLHLGGFSLSGDVFGPWEIIGPQLPPSDIEQDVFRA